MPIEPASAALGWSVTRHKLLRACERAAYWTYWGAQGGWRGDAAADARRAWALKHLSSVPLTLGTAVHNAAREVVAAVRDRRPLPSYDALLAGCRHTLNHAWRASQPDHVHRFWQWPAAHPALHEVVVRSGLTQAEIEGARLTLAAVLRHLLEAPVLGDLAACRPADVHLGRGGPERVLLDQGTTVWVAPDFVYRHDDPGTIRGDAAALVGESAWCVGDWKTGRPDPADERLQLATGTLALEAQGVPPAGDGHYLGRIIHLKGGTETWYAITPEDRVRARAVIAADVERQRRFYVDRERGTLQPVAAFPIAQDRRRCAACNFFPICRDDPTALGADPPPSADDGGDPAPDPDR